MLNPRILISINPATLEKVGQVKATPIGEISKKVEAARKAYYSWKQVTLKERVKILRRMQQLLLERSEDIAKLITAEMGRPYTESLVIELQASVDLMGYCASQANRLLRDRPLHLHHLLFKRRKSLLDIQPLGVMGIITPWNWPLLIPLGFILPAILSGNAVVFKPSELTPLVGEEIRKICIDAGIPEGVFQLVQGPGSAGKALVSSGVNKIFFTGSTSVGRHVMEQASHSLINVVLELGGSDPAIVCEDVDIENATSGIVWGTMNNCGQNCNSIERVYVHQSVSDEFINRVIQKIQKLKIGDGMELSTDMGPLASAKQLKKVKEFIHQTKRKGAEILFGGKAISHLHGYYFQPTVILWNKMIPILPEEEIFGPVMIVTPVEDIQKAIELANQSHFGLSASVWTRDLKQGEWIANQLETGSVMINDSVVSFGVPEASWTGVKNSGIGWVHGDKGFDEMVNIQHIHVDPQYHSQKFWWFPYSEKMMLGLRAGLVFLFHKNIFKKLKAVPLVLKSFSSYLLVNRRKKDKI
jgi:acyl-CoA reductase-like NAD-dependent aldehyde dehydrogenase